MRFVAFAILAFVASPVAPLAAQEWGPPTAEYTATLTFTDGRGEVLVHRIAHTPKRQRLDYKSGDQTEIVVVDQVAAAVFILYPERKRFLKAALVDPEFDLGIGRADTKREKIADEPVAGIPASKYRVEAKTGQGQEFKGFAWLTAQRILVKLDGEVKQGRRTRRLSMIAGDLKVGPVDGAAFQVPADYAPVEDKRK